MKIVRVESFECFCVEVEGTETTEYYRFSPNNWMYVAGESLETEYDETTIKLLEAALNSRSPNTTTPSMPTE